MKAIGKFIGLVCAGAPTLSAVAPEPPCEEQQSICAIPPADQPHTHDEPAPPLRPTVLEIAPPLVELAMIGSDSVGSPATQLQARELGPLSHSGGSSGAAPQRTLVWVQEAAPSIRA
jgi:hypothetical protein